MQWQSDKPATTDRGKMHQTASAFAMTLLSGIHDVVLGCLRKKWQNSSYFHTPAELAEVNVFVRFSVLESYKK